MGGCSSKPKTRDFEVGLGLQEENLQEEASRKNLEAENAGWEGIKRQQEVYELPIQTRVMETKEQDETQDLPPLPEKKMIDCFKGETPVLNDDCQHVKQVLEETVSDSEVDKDLPSNQELLKLEITPEILTSESSDGLDDSVILASESLDGHDDSVLIIDFTREFQGETPLPAARDAGTINAQHKTLSLSNGNLENAGKYIFSDSHTPSLQDAPSAELKPMCPQGGHLALSKDDLCVEGADILELQKELMDSMDSGGVDPGLQEEASERKIESEYHGTVNENGEQRSDEYVPSQEQDKQSADGVKECKEWCRESEAGTCEVVKAASEDVLDLESQKEVLKDFIKPVGEGMITGEACNETGYSFMTGTIIGMKSPVAEASDQESSGEIASTDNGHLAIITDASKVISQQVMYEQTEEQEADVDAAASKSAVSLVKVRAEPDREPIKDQMAVKDVIPQADGHLVNDVLKTVSSVESLDTTDGEGELVCGKNCIGDNHLSQPVVVVEESSGLKLETSGKDSRENKPCDVAVDFEGQQKSDGSSTPDEVTAVEVSATAKKPEAQSVRAMEFIELAFIPAQDIPAPDIDEVLEKLASEFERQERVACATP